MAATDVARMPAGCAISDPAHAIRLLAVRRRCGLWLAVAIVGAARFECEAPLREVALDAAERLAVHAVKFLKGVL